MLVGAAALRWVGWVWVTIVAVVNLHRVDHPAMAAAAVVAMGIVTVGSQAALSTGWGVGPTDRRLIGAEITVATVALLLDGWVRQGRVSGQSLAGTWPLAAILVAGAVAGPGWGAGVGGLFGAARATSALVAGTAPGQGGRAAVAAVSTALFWVAIGAVTGAVVRFARDAQERLAEGAARERIARDLHDSVLQTLTLIERRAPTVELAQLARDQERELRAYLFGDHQAPGSLAAELRAVAARAERQWAGTTVSVVMTDDIPRMDPAQVQAGAAAVAEAITNAAKHGAARRVVVFADLDDATGGLFLSVKDDGSGFDPDILVEGVGIRESIRARVERVGGRASLIASRGDGCEVRLELPGHAR
jgi:signal transduction histidine kinase